MRLEVLVLCAGLLGSVVGDKDDVMRGDDVVEKEDKVFSERWRSLYSADALKNQPRWKLAEQQPADSDYEVRNYEDAYWASSHEPCWDQETAASYGYVNLYFYFGGFNYQGFHHPLTYPIITRVEKVNDTDDETETLPVKGKRRGRGGKRDRRPKKCPIKHSAMLYLPTEKESEIAVPVVDTTTTERVPQRVVYVKEYFNNFTSSYCNQQAAGLALNLVQDGVQFNADDWFCARYIPGIMELATRYEVWFVGTKE